MKNLNTKFGEIWRTDKIVFEWCGRYYQRSVMWWDADGFCVSLGGMGTYIRNESVTAIHR